MNLEMSKKMKILCLKSKSESIQNYGKELNFQIDFCDVIKIEPCLNGQSILAKICSEDAFVFTSFNAVQLLEPYYRKDNKAVYCVGDKGAELLEKYFDNVQSAPTVKALAEIILNDKIESLVHFKGSLSLDTLKNSLKESETVFNEELVYETSEIQPKIDKLEKYNALLFFSPSGVRSFLKNNSFPDAIIGAIGETTRNAIDLDDVVISTNSNTHELLKGIRTKHESLAHL